MSVAAALVFGLGLGGFAASLWWVSAWGTEEGVGAFVPTLGFVSAALGVGVLLL